MHRITVKKRATYSNVSGWGIDAKSGLEYWQYANTWGYDFGENGFFRVAITNLPEEVAAGNI